MGDLGNYLFLRVCALYSTVDRSRHGIFWLVGRKKIKNKMCSQVHVGGNKNLTCEVFFFLIFFPPTWLKNSNRDSWTKEYSECCLRKLDTLNSHSRFKVTYPVPIQGWISQASKLQTCYKFQEFIFLGRQVILIIYVIIKQLFMEFTPALYGNTLPINASLN